MLAGVLLLFLSEAASGGGLSGSVDGEVWGRWFSGDRRFDGLVSVPGAKAALRARGRAEEWRAVAEGRLYVQRDSGDGVADLDLREGYLEWDPAEAFRVRAGRQLISWGRADVFNPTDLISPRLYGLLATDPASEQKSGAWVAQARYFSESAGTFEVDLVPALRASEIYFGGRAIARSDAQPGIGQAGAAVRWDRELPGVDLGVSYFNGIDPTGNIGIAGLQPTQYFRRVEMAGVDGAVPLGAFAARWEAAYSWLPGKTGSLGERKDELFAVAGVEWKHEELHVLVQGAFKRVFGLDPDAYAGTPFAAVEYSSRFFHQQLRSSFGFLSARPAYAILDRTLEGDLLLLREVGGPSYGIRPRLTWSVREQLKLTAGCEFFGGGDEGVLAPLKLNRLAFIEAGFHF